MTKRAIIPIAAAMLSATLLAGVASANPPSTANLPSPVPRASSVPELAVSAAGGALVIIAGAALIFAGRRRRAKKL